MPVDAPVISSTRWSVMLVLYMGYESWYLKASHPSEPIGVWIRYTTAQRPGQPETGSL